MSKMSTDLPPDVLRRIDCFVINLGRFEELEQLLPAYNNWLEDNEQLTPAQLITIARDIWMNYPPQNFLEEMLRYLNEPLDRVIVIDPFNFVQPGGNMYVDAANLGVFMLTWLQTAGDCL